MGHYRYRGDEYAGRYIEVMSTGINYNYRGGKYERFEVLQLQLTCTLKP